MELKKLRISLFILMGAVTFGCVGYRFVENMSWFDAFYMTVITITTVGYGETHELTASGRVFTIFLIALLDLQI